MITLDEMVLKLDARVKENAENKFYLDASIFWMIRQEIEKMDDEQTIEVTDARAQELLDKALAAAKVRLGQVVEKWKIAL
jgi:uncharacterized protein with NAD-binding domain and iron-sulfur cluster